MLSNEPWNCNVRVVGVNTEYALIPPDEVLIEWADEIVCAEQEHADAIIELMKKFENEQSENKPIHVLNVPDCFTFRDPELVELIQAALKNVGFEGTPTP